MKIKAAKELPANPDIPGNNTNHTFPVSARTSSREWAKNGRKQVRSLRSE
jgi:hypothetical protein